MNKVKIQDIHGRSVTNSSAMELLGESLAYCAGNIVVSRSQRHLFLQPQPSQTNYTHDIQQIQPIGCLAYSKSGKFIATGEVGGLLPRVLVYDLSNSNIVAELTGHKFGIQSVHFSDCEEWIISVGHVSDGRIIVWDWKNAIHPKKTETRTSKKVHSLSIDPFGDFFVTVGLKNVLFWTISTDKMGSTSIHKQSANLGELKDLKFVDVSCIRHDSKPLIYCITENAALAVITQDRILHKWLDLKSSRGLSIATNKTTIACGCSEGIIRLFQVETLKFITSLQIDNFKQNVISLSASNHQIAALYDDNSLNLWDIETNKLSVTFDANVSLWGVKMIPNYSNDSTIAVNSSDGSIKFYNIENGDILQLSSTFQLNNNLKEPSKDFKKDIKKLCISQDGSILACGDVNGRISVYNVKSMEKIADIKSHNGEILCLIFSSDNDSKYLASAGRDRLIHIYDTQLEFRLVQTLTEHTSSIICLKFCRGFKWLISTAADKSILFREYSDETLFSKCVSHIGNANIYDLEFDNQRNSLITVNNSQQVVLYSLETQLVVQTICQPDTVGSFLKVCISSSGVVAIASSDKSIFLLNDKNEWLDRVTGHSEMITGMDFSLDGSRLVSVGTDGLIILWNLSNLVNHLDSKTPIIDVESQPCGTPSRIKWNERILNKGLSLFSESHEDINEIEQFDSDLLNVTTAPNCNWMEVNIVNKESDMIKSFVSSESLVDLVESDDKSDYIDNTHKYLKESEKTESTEINASIMDSQSFEILPTSNHLEISKPTKLTIETIGDVEDDEDLINSDCVKDLTETNYPHSLNHSNLDALDIDLKNCIETINVISDEFAEIKNEDSFRKNQLKQVLNSISILVNTALSKI